MKRFYPILFVVLLALERALGGEPAWVMSPDAQVDERGLFLTAVVSPNQQSNAPSILLAPAPAVGRFDLYSRAQVAAMLQKAAPELNATNWAGATRLRVTRRTRVINEKELKAQLTAALQKMQGADHGDIEVQITHPTGDVVVGTGPAALQLVDFPATGLNSTMVLRFQMASEAEVFGTWQASVQVHLWRDILVASGMLARGQELAEAEVESERRDVLQMRDALSASRRSDASLELIENVNPGTVLTVRSVRRRPLVQRGKVVAAQVVDGPLNITVKVEVLEDGASGQTVRVRNLQSKREFQGKVQNDQTVLVTL